MLFSGDFRQTMPVVDNANSEAAIVGHSLIKCEIFTKGLIRYKLKINMRAFTYRDNFKGWQGRIRDGMLEED